MKIWKIAQDMTPEQQKVADFWEELDKTFPQTEKWRGNPTWDFGNGVKISLTNMPRNVYTDDLFWSVQRDPVEWITVYIENISSGEKGKGYASMAIERLKQIANKYGIILRLWPKQTEKGKDFMKDKQLKDWYKRHGFGDNLSHGSDARKDFPTQKALYLELGQ